MIIKVFISRSRDNKNAPNFILNTDIATAADHLSFIENIINLLQEDKKALEKEANASNRTMNHDLFKAVGTIAINPQ